MSKELTELKEALPSLNLYLRELLLGMKKILKRWFIIRKLISVWYALSKLIENAKHGKYFNKNSISLMSSIGKKVLHTSGGQALWGWLSFCSVCCSRNPKFRSLEPCQC